MHQAALITGSSRGIGLAIALCLAERGFNIALNAEADTSELANAALQTAARGVRVTSIACDIADLSQHESLLDAAETACGPLTTLVNNAGVAPLARDDLLSVSVESYDRCQSINTRAAFFLTQAFARRLVARERPSHLHYTVVNVTSSNAVAASILRGEYCVSKAAAAMTSRLFAVRLAGAGISVFDVQPGVIETDMTRPAADAYRQRIEHERLTLIPRIGRAPAPAGVREDVHGRRLQLSRADCRR